MDVRHWLILLTCLGLASCQSTGTQNPSASEPHGPKGTYANRTLQRDAMQHVFLYLATQDCQEIDHVRPYIFEFPTGDAGEKEWKEQWIVEGCDKEFDIIMSFREDGNGGAYFRVSPND